MLRLLADVQKVRGRSVSELTVRAVQALHARAERLGPAGRGQEPADDTLRRELDPALVPAPRRDAHALRRHFLERGASHFFPGLADRRATVAQLRSRWPEAARDTLRHADAIAAGRLDVFGHQLRVDGSPDWQREPLSGARAPAVHWSRIAFLDPHVAGDCKFTWELNRHQHFLTLGRAYWLTGDERYARAFAGQLASWMDRNPPKLGINWASSLEVALRAIAWLWAVHLFRESPALDAPLLQRLLKLLHVHGRHLETYLSTYFSPNTHLTGEALGLLYLGVALPELRRAARWRTLGALILQEQLERQVLPDGVYFEQSTYYHRYTTDFYLHASVLAEAHGLPLAGMIRTKLHAMCDYLLHITRPDGTAPLIGDDDGGRLVTLGERPANDFRDTLGIAAIVLGRGDLAFVAAEAPVESLWLLGPAALRRFDALAIEEPSETSRAFRHGGYFIMRDRWARDADCAIVRCGSHGALTGAHAHADALSLELAVAGHPLLIDPGTYTYSAAAPERDALRTASAHNTLTLDDCSSAEPGATPFTWRTMARAAARCWITHRWCDVLVGEHDGYTRLQHPAIHERTVFHVKDGYWVLRDRVRSATPHRLALHLHWAAGTRVRGDGERMLTARAPADGPSLQAVVFGSGAFAHEHGWISTAYGSREEAPVSVFRQERADDQELITILAARGRLAVAECSSQRTVGSTILSLPHDDGADAIFIGADDRVVSDGVDVRAAWSWMRRAPSGELLRLFAIHVRSVVVDGHVLLHSTAPVSYLAARRVHAGWELERGDGQPVARER